MLDSSMVSGIFSGTALQVIHSGPVRKDHVLVVYAFAIPLLCSLSHHQVSPILVNHLNNLMSLFVMPIA